MSLPTHNKVIIIGAGIHGWSAAYHMSKELRDRRKGSGEDILVIDKTAIGAGASKIGCSVIRNNYYKPALQELIARISLLGRSLPICGPPFWPTVRQDMRTSTIFT